MTIRDMEGTVDDKIPVKTILVSVTDKRGLDELIPGLLELEPDMLIISTGGTYTTLKEILGTNHSHNLTDVATYTGFPEMQGGLVKTLHPKIYAGILAERNNKEHQRYLAEELNGAKYIDMVIVNLYPFQNMIATPGVTFEKARGNIDIGGPAMLRAAAKNFMSCAAIRDPVDYISILDHIRRNEGSTTFAQRLDLARKVFTTTSGYDAAIAEHISYKIATSYDNIVNEYKFSKP